MNEFSATDSDLLSASQSPSINIEERFTLKDHIIAPVIYSSFQQASQHLHALMALDYFLAKELLTSLVNHQPELANDTELCHFYFHLVVLLSQEIRAGNTCLATDNISAIIIGSNSDETGILTHQGYHFPNHGQVADFISRCAINPEQNQLTVWVNNKLYLRRYYQFEQQLSLLISNKFKQKNNVDNQLIKSCLAGLFVQENNDIDWQLISVANALKKRFSVIAGGPGTGKTYTVTKLLAGLVMLHQHQHQHTQAKTPLKVCLTAPTGKAAQRLTESISKAIEAFRQDIDESVLAAIPCQATTLHRLLGVIPFSPNFRHHQENKLDVDVLLIDEVSMVDLAMMTRVMQALPEHCNVILLGDADQLPSVEVGSVLADIAPRPHLGYSRANLGYLQEVISDSSIKSLKSVSDKKAADHVTYLTKSRRFQGDGIIGLLAKAVINSEVEHSWQLLSQASEQVLAKNDGHPLYSAADIEQWLPPLVSHYYQPLFDLTDVEAGFKQLSLFRVLAAIRKSEQGVEAINLFVKQLFVQKGLVSTRDNLYHGLPIMITENNRQTNLYNGDVGLIWRHSSGQLMAVFEQADGQYLWLIPSRLPSYETVYAMTIHKTQGSEFNHVAMVLPKQRENKLMSRELLYTGITRAKSLLSIYCYEHVWKNAVDTKVQRTSGLVL